MSARRQKSDTTGSGSLVPAAGAISWSRWAALWATALAALMLGACHQDEALQLRYEGTPGLEVPIRMVSGTPAVATRYELSTTEDWSGWFFVDTGSPVTLIDTQPLGLSEGLYSLSVVETMGLSFLEREGIALALGEPESWTGGILGGDILRFFCLHLDYRGLRGALYTGCLTETLGSLEGVDPPTEVPIQPRGGGRLFLDDGSHIDVGPTRVLVEVSIEGSRETAVLDTGASTPVFAPGLGAALFRAMPDRPTLSGVPVTTVSGTQDATLMRLSSMSMGDSEIASVACLWVADPTPFEDLSQEVGRRVQLLVGGSFLRYFAFSMDYPAKKLTLARYRETPHIDPEEFHSVGAIFHGENGEVLVERVFPYTDAWEKGLQKDDVVVELDETAVSNVQEIEDLLDTRLVEERVLFTLQRGGETIQMELLIENLLPELYESPDPLAP